MNFPQEEWEYLIFTINNVALQTGKLEDLFNQAGMANWELIQVVDGFALFKRPKHG